MSANLLMKTITNPIMRRFGLRRVLKVNGVIAADCFAACGAISPVLSSLALNFSRLLLHASVLTPVNFRISLGLMAALGALAVFFYANLAESAGIEVTGGRRREGVG